jgi:hypothetical protein
MTDVDILRAARALIADERHFTRYRMARTADDVPVSPAARTAERWCAFGAIIRAIADADAVASEYEPNYCHVLQSAINMRFVLDGVAMDLWPQFAPSTFAANDNLGHDGALKLFDAAIARLQALAQPEADLVPA